MSTYLDYNATAPLKPQVIEATSAVLAETGNASSVHGFGRNARKRVEESREAVAALAGASPQGVVFTSGGTEANALALNGTGRPVLASAVEHDCVLAWTEENNRLPVDPQGRLDVNALEERLSVTEQPVLVSLQLANNETGVIQPITEVAKLVHAAGGLLHCDAVQAPGKITVSMENLGCDLMSLSAHKFGGPQGVGALVLRPGLAIEPFLKGGGQEQRRRAGTENVAAIAGFGAAARLAVDSLAEAGDWAVWRDAFERDLLAMEPETSIFGSNAPRLPQTSCFAVPALSAETLLMALDLEGFALSSGSACSSGKVGRSHVLAAMGVAPEPAKRALRLSFGWNTRSEDLSAVLNALITILDKQKKVSAA